MITKGLPNLRVNTTCAMRVQVTNMTREYHEVFSHLYLRESEKGDCVQNFTIEIHTPRMRWAPHPHCKQKFGTARMDKTYFRIERRPRTVCHCDFVGGRSVSPGTQIERSGTNHRIPKTAKSSGSICSATAGQNKDDFEGIGKNPRE